MSDPRPVRGMIFVGAGTYVGEPDDLWIHKNAYDALAARVAAADHALRVERAKFDSAIKHLVAITGMLAPDHIRLPDGRVMEFAPPAESVMGYWRGLTDAIKAAREHVCKAEQPPADRGCHE